MEYTSTITGESKTCPGVSFVLYKPSYGRVLAFDRTNAEYREEIRQLSAKWETLKEEFDEVRKDWDGQQAERKKELTARLDDAQLGDEWKRETETALRRIDNGYEYERLTGILAILEPEDEQYKELKAKRDAIEKDRDRFVTPRHLAAAFQEMREQSDLLAAEKYNPARLRWGLVSLAGLTIDGEPATVESLIASGPTDLVVEIVQRIDEVSGMPAEQLKNSVLLGTSNAAEPSSATSTTATAA